jgi:hypothetical protein
MHTLSRRILMDKFNLATHKYKNKKFKKNLLKLGLATFVALGSICSTAKTAYADGYEEFGKKCGISGLYESTVESGVSTVISRSKLLLSVKKKYHLSKEVSEFINIYYDTDPNVRATLDKKFTQQEVKKYKKIAEKAEKNLSLNYMLPDEYIEKYGNKSFIEKNWVIIALSPIILGILLTRNRRK